MLHTQPTSTYPKKISRPKLPQHPLAAPNLNVPQPRSSRRLCAITFLRTSGLHVNGTNFWGVALFRSGPGRPIVENRTRRAIGPSVLYRLRATQKLAPFMCNHLLRTSGSHINCTNFWTARKRYKTDGCRGASFCIPCGGIALYWVVLYSIALHGIALCRCVAL